MTVDALALSQALIRCNSVTPADGGALGVLGEALTGLGFDVRRKVFSADGTPDVDNLYARIGATAPNFCFAGHTDVVPVGDENAWSVDPFGAEIRDGVLYGRGASDMKAAIAAFVAATSQYLEKTGGDVPGSISLLITGDEEGPAINGTKKLLEWIADEGETLDVCLVGEPTNPEAMGDMVKIGRRGSLTARLEVTGIQGHTAYPHLADNPIHRLVGMLDAITGTPLDEGTDRFQASTLQVASVDTGNTAGNVIPAKVNALFNVRFNDLHTGASVTDWLHERFREAGAVDGEHYSLDVHVSGEAFLTPPGKLSDVLCRAVEEVTGRAPELSTSGGTSDARFIKDYCPVAEFGLVGKTMHKVDEQMPVSDVESLTRIYVATLDGFFSQP